MRRRFLGQFAWVAAGKTVAALLQAALFVLVLRLVSPAEFGLLAATLGLATLAQTLVDMGVGTFISRERARSRSSPDIAIALKFNSMTSVALAVLIALALGSVGGLVDPLYILMLPLSLTFSSERNADAYLNVIFADGDAKINVMNLVGRRIVALALFGLLTMLAIHAVLVFSIATALAGIASAVFAHGYLRNKVAPPGEMTYGELVRQSWPYWLNSVATQARNIDVALTTLLAGATQAGFYSSASRLTNPLRLLPNSMASVLMPAATRAQANGSSLRPLLKIVAVSLVIITAMYAALFLLMPWALPVLLGEAYVGSVPAAQVVVAGLPFAALASMLGSLLQARGSKHFVALTAVVTTVICLILVVPGAVLYGAVGAAAALAISFTVQSVMLAIGYIRAPKREA